MSLELKKTPSLPSRDPTTHKIIMRQVLVFTKGMDLFTFIYVHLFLTLFGLCFFFKGNLQNHLIHKIQFVEGLGWRVKKWLLLLSVVLPHMESSFCCIRFHSLALLIGVYITCFFRFGNKAL